MNGREVTLTGTWSRDKTSAYEITAIRRRTYNMNRWAQAEIPRVRSLLYFRVKQAGWTEKTRDEAKTRTGTFKAVLFVPCVSGMSAKRAISRARVLLKWHVQDITCVPPTFHIDTAEVGRGEVRNDVGTS